MNKINVFAGVALLAFAAAPAYAVQVNGGFSFGNVTGGSATVDSFNTPTTINFNPASGGAGNVQTSAGGVTGDFVGYVNGSELGDIVNVTSNAFGPSAGFITIAATGGAINFDLINFPFTGTGGVIVSGTGTGTLTAAGFDPTPAFFIFTTQFAGSNTNSWSASITTTAPPGFAPEPSSLALMGLGLLGAVGARRRAKRKG